MSLKASTESRRGFLQALSVGGSALLLPACTKSAPPLEESKECPPPLKPRLPEGLQAGNFIIHGESPLGLEVRRSKIGSGVITPASLFFVRNNLPMPPAEVVERANAWVLSLRGVAREGSISLGELKGLGPRDRRCSPFNARAMVARSSSTAPPERTGERARPAARSGPAFAYRSSSSISGGPGRPGQVSHLDRRRGAPSGRRAKRRRR